MNRDQTPPHLEDDLQKQLRRLRASYHMSEVVARAVDLQTIYEAAIEALVDALGVHRASVLLFDPDGVMRFKASHGLSATYCRAVEGHSPWKQEDPNPLPILVPDVNH